MTPDPARPVEPPEVDEIDRLTAALAAEKAAHATDLADMEAHYLPWVQALETARDQALAERDDAFGGHGVVLGIGPDDDVFSVSVDGDTFIPAAERDQALAERDAALYKQEQADKRAALAYKDAEAAETARDQALAERDALDTAFQKEWKWRIEATTRADQALAERDRLREALDGWKTAYIEYQVKFTRDDITGAEDSAIADRYYAANEALVAALATTPSTEEPT